MIAVGLSYDAVCAPRHDDSDALGGVVIADGSESIDVTLHARSGAPAPKQVGLCAAAKARLERSVLAPAKMGPARDAPPAAPGAQSVAEGSSAAWDLCGNIRKYVRAQLEKAVEDGIVLAAGTEATASLFSDIGTVQALRSYVAAVESMLAANSYVSSGTYMIDARRLMVALRTNAMYIIQTMSASEAAFARSSKLMKHAPRTRSLAMDDANRDAFDRALKCTDGWVSENPAGKSANARDLQCPKCYSSENVSFRARQDRAGDEGMTYYVVCRNCHNVSKL